MHWNTGGLGGGTWQGANNNEVLLKSWSVSPKLFPWCTRTRWRVMLWAHKRIEGGRRRRGPSSSPHRPSPPDLGTLARQAVAAAREASGSATTSPSTSCRGRCPNVSRSHLGLAKPVPTDGGGGEEGMVGGRRHDKRRGERSPLTGTQWPKDWTADWARYR